MSTKDIISKLERIGYDYEQATDELISATVELLEVESLISEAKTAAIIRGQDEGALDGKNEGERKLKLEAWLAGDKDLRATEERKREADENKLRSSARLDNLRFQLRVVEAFLAVLSEGRGQ